MTRAKKQRQEVKEEVKQKQEEKIKQETKPEPAIEKTGVFSVSPSTIDFKTDSEHVQLVVKDANGTDVTQRVKFATEDGSVANVSKTGLVSPVKEGTCIISANAEDGSLAYVTVKVA